MSEQSADLRRKGKGWRGIISILALTLSNDAIAGFLLLEEALLYLYCLVQKLLVLTFKICVIPRVFRRSARLAWSKLPINRKPGMTSVGKALGVCMSAFSSI